jgi:DNA-directed RNA polymerase specialized sigma24 family protein
VVTVPVKRPVHEPPVTASRLDAESADWLRQLGSTGPQREAAIARLHDLLVRIARGEVGRHLWRHPSVPLDAEDWDQLPDRFGFDPAQEAEWRDLLAALRCAVNEELTPRQRAVFVAIVLNDVPLDALVLELASNRNAIYKVLFDARRKLRAALDANGYLRADTSRHT